MFQRRYLKTLGKDEFTRMHGFETIEDEQLEAALKVVRDRTVLR